MEWKTRMMRNRLGLLVLFGFVVGCVLAGSGWLHAQGPTKYIAYDVPAGTVGNQNFGNGLGLDFDVQLDILITRLGVFDSGSDGLALPITARLFDRDTQEELAVLEFTPEEPGDLVGGSRFKEYEIDLPAGFHGSIVASGYGDLELNGNGFGNPTLNFSEVNDGGCAILFTGGGRFGGDAVSLPGSPDGGPPNRYAAGTFEFIPQESFPAPTGGIAYNVPVATPGNQAFPGALGLDFNVNTPILVTRLGVFDANSDGLMAPITARLYLRDTRNEIVNLEFTPEDFGDPVEGSVFKDLVPPLRLPAGFKGSIVAEGYNDLEMNGNLGAPVPWTLDGGGCTISFRGGGRFGDAGTYPSSVDAGPPNRYAAGTFEFDVDPNPPPPPPDFPTNFLATAGDAKVDLTWDASAGTTPAVKYRVFRAPDLSSPFTQLAEVTGTSHTDSPLPNEVGVCYFVRAVSATDVESFDSIRRCAVPVAPPPPGSVISYKVETGVFGNQAHGGELGMDFDVAADIVVTRIGVFDDGSDGLAVPITARIYDRDLQSEMALVDFLPDDPGVLIDGSRFKKLDEPLQLLAGFHGTMSASGYGGSERNGNQGVSPVSGLTTDDGGCRIDFIGGGRFSGAPGAFPDQVDGGPVNRYAAGTFMFESLGDPVPTTAQPPTNLIALTSGSDINLRWTPPPLRTCIFVPTGYRVLRSAAGGPFEALADVTESTYVDGSAAAGTDYCYVVRSIVEGGGVSGDSNVSCASPGRYIAYVVPGGIEGTQVDSQAVGMDFDVTRSVQVTRLGAFDSGGDGLAAPITVRIFDRSLLGEEVEVASLEFSPADPGVLLGGSRFKALPEPLDLPSGFKGTIVAEGYGLDEPNGVGGPWVTNTGPCSIFFDGHGRLGFGAPVLGPVNLDGRPDLYAAGTFEFVPQEFGTPQGAIAYLVPEGTIGNQGNHPGTLGLDFDVNVGIKVTRLGVFDSGSDGLLRTLVARLQNRDTEELLAELTFPPEDQGDLEEGSRFKTLPTPVSLPAGFHGTIVSFGHGAEEPDGNQFAGTDLDITTDDGGCAISFVGGGRFAPTDVFPNLIDSGPANRYASATFEFEIDTTEPGKTFHRGDADDNGQLQLTDAIRILGVLFLGQGVITCMDAADADDNGSLQLTDAIRILGVLFLGQGTIPAPGPTSEPCGLDPTPDGGGDIGCATYTHC